MHAESNGLNESGGLGQLSLEFAESPDRPSPRSAPSENSAPDFMRDIVFNTLAPLFLLVATIGFAIANSG